jgi:ssDNA-binding Zn-finger/Zn-ribbon topoisomerase 1
MILKDSRYGWFYGCSAFPKCKATHGTHPNGEPLGIPADKETKGWRMKAHVAFDTLWNDPNASMSRSEAYRWMSETLALDSSDSHISMFGINRCKQLIEAIRVKDELAEINDCVDWVTVRSRRAEKKHGQTRYRKVV